MIVDERGRYNSVRTINEIEKLLGEDFSSLTEDERQAVLDIVNDINQAGVSPMLSLMNEATFIRPKVPIEDFIREDQFLGKFQNTLYDVVKQDLVEIFNGHYDEITLGGSTGCGKSTTAQMTFIRMLYELSLLGNPSEAYGIMQGDMITFQCVALTRELAHTLIISKLQNYLKQIPYFTTVFKPLKMLEGEGTILFPNQIMVAPGASSEVHTIGSNTFGGIIEETNFFKATKKADGSLNDKVSNIYTSIKRRMENRFKKYGRLPGKLIIVSSKTTADSFTDKLIRKNIDNPNMFIRERAFYEAAPKERFSDKKFRVAIGTEAKQSRILSDNEPDPEGMNVIEVPEDFRGSFEVDIDLCLDGETIIPLLNGEKIKIKDLVGRDNFWVYSSDKSGQLVAGKGYDARLTIKNAKVITVTLDNGEKIRCTPNHPFMMRDGSYVEAIKLISGDSLMPLYLQLHKQSGRMIHRCNKTKKLEFVHRSVMKGYGLTDELVVHHKDGNKLNNDPDNLEIMQREDHSRLHNIEDDGKRFFHTKDSWDKGAKTRSKKICEQKEEWAIEHRKRSSKFITEYNKSDEHKKVASLVGKKHNIWGENATEKQILSRQVTTDIARKRFIEMNRNNNPMKSEVAREGARLRANDRIKNPKFLEMCKENLRKGTHTRHHVNKGIVKDDCQYCLLIKNNHKVVSVEDGGYCDVYDISVEEHHNFLVEAGVFVHNSIRDTAGYATAAISPFLARREKLYECIDKKRAHPFGHFIWSHDFPFKVSWSKIATYTHSETGVVWRPLVNPHAPRHLHIDISKNKDMTGLCIGHVAGMLRINRTGQAEEYHPVYYIDLVLQIQAQTGGEVVQSELRKLVYEFSQKGFYIKTVSADQYQSLALLQTMKSAGYNTELVSMDRTPEPYNALKLAFYENRINMYRYEPLMNELIGLQRDGKTGKIDHPDTGSKDISDAMAAVIYTLSKSNEAQFSNVKTYESKRQMMDDENWVLGDGSIVINDNLSNTVYGNQNSERASDLINEKKRKYELPFVTG